MLTPEREKEIRELGNGNEFELYDAKEELLAEIDRLREENQLLYDRLKLE